MISNSRLVTSHIAFGSEVPPSTTLADTYSDDLMDDLFMDVDQILDGDLSSYMTVVGNKPKPVNPATRTVQLPANFVPRSAADLYRATLEASRSESSPSTPEYVTTQYQPAQPQSSPPQSAQYRPLYNHHSGYNGGGRPVTSARQPDQLAAHLGNFQTAIIQSPNPGQHNFRDNPRPFDTQSTPIHPPSNTLYPQSSPSALKRTHISPRPPQTIFEPEPEQQVSLPFLLMGAAGISVVSTLGLWTVSHSAPSNGWLLSLNQEASAAELPSNSTADFLAYLQQSLDVITARQENADRTVSVIPVVNKVATLPTTVPNTNPAPQLGALPNLPGAVAPAPNVIERVFVPVYQNGQTTAAPANTASAGNLPSVALPNISANRPTVPVPGPVAAAAAIPPGAPAAATPSVPIVQSGAGQLPAPNAAIAVAPTNAAASITDVTPNSENVLVGILNLGSRSAALFNIDGSSQRAYVGDRVGVSNWTLVSVNGQDIVVRRDGEVRSVYIGQRF